MKQCLCGCATPINDFDKYGRDHRYVAGHQWKGHGENHIRWKGGRYKDVHGYMQVRRPEHHFIGKSGYIPEHRIIWEEHNKAVLLPWADIHHINGNKSDNRIENLQLMNRSEHLRHHMTGNIRGHKDMTNRVCFVCKSNKTDLQKTRNMGLRPRWYIDQSNGKWLCRNCYENKRRWE